MNENRKAEQDRQRLVQLLADFTIWTAALLAGTLIVLYLAGCGTTPYKTLGSVAAAVDKARTYYADQIVAGKVDEAKQAKIDAAVVKYQASFHVAVALARFDYKAPAPAEVSAAATDILNLINALK